jgi:putative oxidoreductase
MESLNKFAPLAGRVLLALPFLMAGIGKFAAPEAMGGYMASVGLPTVLLYPSAIFEVAAGLLLIVGFQTRWVALLTAAFTLLATAIFHNNLGDQVTQLMALKNLAMIGGLLYVAAYGAGAFSIDNAGKTLSTRPAQA